MAKRTRGVGVRNTHRPGGGPPIHDGGTTRPSMGRGAEPPAAIPGAPPRSPEAGDPVAAAVAVADAGARSTTPAAPARSTRGRVKVKADSLLASRAVQDEYLYVAQDLRRIAVVAVSLFAALVVLWLFFTQVDPFGIY